MGTDLRAGLVIAERYRLERELGHGGMGAVWAATHMITRRSVAMKFVIPGIGRRVEMRRRLLREARAATAARHPNVVEVYDVFDFDDDTPVMVMALLRGETLAQYFVRESPRSLSTVASLMLPVVSAVGAAHATGIVHRDLKPENIFLSQEDGKTVVRVLDFGIAKLAEREGSIEPSKITAAGYLLGTPCYMSPEQLFGDPDLDHRADIWSIGAILYEGLGGVRPIDGDNAGQVFKHFLTRKITPICTILPDLPEDMCALTMGMLARAREERPNDLREAYRVLHRHGYVSAPPFGPPGVAPLDASMAPITGNLDGPPYLDRGGSQPQEPSDVEPSTREIVNRLPLESADARGLDAEGSSRHLAAADRSQGAHRAAPAAGHVMSSRVRGVQAHLIETAQAHAAEAPWEPRLHRNDFGPVVEIDLAPQITLRLRKIPSGRFLMGSVDSEAGRRHDEEPRHEVVLSEGLWLAETPCTQAEWRAVTGREPSRFRGDLRPVERVTWEDCRDFFHRIAAAFQGLRLRLPTEAEWEYACRAGSTTAFYGGSECTASDGEDPALETLGWYAGNSDGATKPVRQLLPNSWGLYDMLGNVWEWCQDNYGPYPAAPRVNPTGPPDGHVRVTRGGSWVNLPRLCRSASRRWRHATNSFDFLGFRVAADAATFPSDLPEGAT